MIKRVQLVNSTQQWRANGRYKVNTVVTYLGVDYQNTTGANSLPSLLTDWIVVSGTGGGSPQKKEAVINVFIEDGVIITNIIYSSLVQIPNFTLLDDYTLTIDNFEVHTENRLFVTPIQGVGISPGFTIYTPSIFNNAIDGYVTYKLFDGITFKNISGSHNETFKIEIFN